MEGPWHSNAVNDVIEDKATVRADHPLTAKSVSASRRLFVWFLMREGTYVLGM